MFNVVTIKLIAPNKLEIDVRWIAKIARSTLGPECEPTPDRGGYQYFLYILIYNIKKLFISIYKIKNLFMIL